MKRFDLKVTGVVQGVCFRISTLDTARALGIRGTVRNEPDGSVFIEAEGDEAALDRFVAWCRQGPPGARVRQLEIVQRALADFADFEITG